MDQTISKNTNPLRILLVSSSSGSRGGGELYLLYLARALAQRGHKVTLWASDHPRMDELSNSFSCFGDVIRAPYQNTYDHPTRSLATRFNFNTSGNIASEWHSLRPEIIHINKQNLEDGLDLLRAATQSGIPSLCTIHLTQSAKYLGAKFATLRDFVSRKALKLYHGPLVTVLDSRKKDLARFIGEDDRISVVPNGVPLFDLAKLRSVRRIKRTELQLETNDFLFLALGRMVAQKRPMLFLELAEKIHAKIPQARFLWVGDGNLSNDWDQWVSQRNLGNIIRRISWQPDVQPFLCAADSFLHVAEYEGLPLALLEAMSAGLPCAVKSNLLAEMPFLNPSNSISVGDDDSWITPLADHELLAKIGEAGRKIVEEQFTHRRMAELYEPLYLKLLAESPKQV
ncbi:MAG TPA: glycosyltransferase family 4 protein [Chthoniobacteraceae bacterium]|nr:glycosyltransferase family 4 protein [Chthoniobacteraceae bacterium]